MSDSAKAGYQTSINTIVSLFTFEGPCKGWIAKAKRAGPGPLILKELSNEFRILRKSVGQWQKANTVITVKSAIQ